MGYIETAYNGPNELDIHDAKLRDIISLAFSEIRAYAKDDYCLYGDTLYVFTSAHPVGPWTGTDVRATSVDEELKSRSSTDSYTKEEVDDLLEDKADVSYVDDELATKANQATTYTKTETDALLSAKANQSTTYTKTEVDTALSGKADKATTYTKEQVDALVSAVFRYKGTKATVADLEAVTEKAVGDVWFVSADSSEYAWNGTVWEKLGPVIDLSGYLTSLTVAGITLDSTHTTITSAQLITALNIYTQTEVDTALNAKADKSTTYTKTETDTLLSTKANQSTVDDLPTNATEMPLSSQDQTTVKDAIDGLGAVMTGATSSTAGVKGLVPAPAAGDERKFLRADGTWVIVQAEGQSVGFLPIIATLAVLDWVQSGTDYVCRITNLAITSSMYVSGLSFVDEINIPGVVTPTIDANNHQVVLTTDVQPLNAVVAYIECAVDGATVLQDVSQLTTPFVGATTSADGRQGLVPKPFIADRRKLLRADGTWDDAQASEVVYENTNVGAALSAQSDQIANKVDKNSTPYLNAVELKPDAGSNIGGFIDFHYDGDSSDYTSRIIEDAYGQVNINGVKFKNGTIDKIVALGPYNGLDSTSTTAALSAAQGKALNNSITQLSDKLGLSLNYKGFNPQDWTTLFSSNSNCIDIYIISGTLPKGAPTNAYGYGILIVITLDPSKPWTDAMIYISDSVETKGVYVKNKNHTNWLKISGESVADKT